MKPLLILVAAALLLGGCASRRCTGELAYQNAQSLPPPVKVEGLKVAESPSALKIPPPPAAVVPFAEPVGDGDVRCLDLPPPMPEQNPDAPAGASTS